MDFERIVDIINGFEKKKVLIIGDVMLDVFAFGSVTRVSPESPGVIFLEKEKKFTPGGAGNVAKNITALGGNVVLIGVVGNDEEAEKLLKVTKNNGIDPIFVKENRPTTVKERFIECKYKHQMPIRRDKEVVWNISRKTEKEIIDIVKTIDFDVIGLVDYRKGLLTKSLVKWIVDYGQKTEKKIIVDPKPDTNEYVKMFIGVDTIKPNEAEMSVMMNVMNTDKKEDMVKMLNITYLVETKGEKGIAVYDKKGLRVQFPAFKDGEIVEISGAGDTVMAGLCLSVDANIEESAFISNIMGGLVVKKATTAVVEKGELIQSIKKVLENG